MSKYLASSLRNMLETQSDKLTSLASEIKIAPELDDPIAFNKTWPENTPGPWQQSWNNWAQTPWK